MLAKAAGRGSKLGVVVLAVAIAAGGCAAVQTVRRPLAPGAIDAINEVAAADGPLEIEYQPGLEPIGPAPRRAKSVLDADVTKTSVVDVSGEERSIDSMRLRSVRVTSRGRGALQGLGTGALFGALAGVGFGYVNGDGFFRREDTMKMGGVVFGVIGGLVGLLVGAAAGQQTVFVFDDRP